MRGAWSVACAAGLLGLGLACGGVSVDPKADLEAVCDAAGPIPDVGSLPRVELAPRPFDAEAAVIVLTEEGVITGLYGWDVKRWDEITRPEPEGEPEPFDPMRAAVAVVAPGSLPASRVARALAMLADDGSDALLVLQNEVPIEPPVAPDPAYADALRAEIATASPDTRVTLLAAEIADLMWLCPPGGEVFAALAMAAPEVRCRLAAQGMSEALPMCPLTSGDRVLSAMHVMMGPAPGQGQVTSVRLRFDDRAPALPAPEGSWAEWAPRLVPLDDQVVAPPR